MLKEMFGKPNAPYSIIWMAVFLYVALVAACIQLIALPYIMPEWHAGDGLIIGGDWVWFNQIAIEISEKIRLSGWHEWMLRPHGQAPAGIAAAIYALTVPQPWTIIPMNAALHASAALMLILIIQRFKIRWQYATVSAMPFIFYPSAMTWYTQLHKDGFFILGSLIFLYGWILLAEEIINTRNLKTLLKPYLFILAGAALVWVVRPYGVQMMQGLSIFMAGGLILFGLVQIKKLPGSFVRRSLITPLLLLLLVVSLTPFTKGGIEINNSIKSDMYWEKTMPTRLDALFYSLAETRNRFTDAYPDAGSNIDNEMRFNKAADILLYVPKAIEVALFAPFPNIWFGSGTTVNSGYIRKVAGIEMLGIYFALIWAVLSFKKWFNIPAWWIIVFYCGGMMTIYGLITVNIGSLYRVRYGFIMTLAALGLAYLLSEVVFKKTLSRNSL